MKVLTITRETQEQNITEFFNEQNNCKSLTIHIEELNQQVRNLQFLKETAVVHNKMIDDLQIKISQKYQQEGDGYKSISEVIQQFIDLKSLSIEIDEYSFMQKCGIQYISDALTSSHLLFNLKISIGQYNYIQSEGMITLLESLKNKQLALFHFSIGNDCTINSSGLIAFFTGLKNLSQLQNLLICLSSSQFNEECSIKLADSLASLQDLKCLSLLFSDINATYIEATIARSIRKLAGLEKFAMKIQSQYFVRSDIVKQFIDSISTLTNLVELDIEDLISDQDYENSQYFSNILKQIPNIKGLKINTNPDQQTNDNLLLNYGENLLYLQKIQFLEIKIQPHSLINEYALFEILERVKQMKSLNRFSLVIQKNNKLFFNGVKLIGETLVELNNLNDLKLTFEEQTLSMQNLIYLLPFLQQLVQLQKLSLQIKCLTNYSQLIEVMKTIVFMKNLVYLSIVDQYKITDYFYEGYYIYDYLPYVIEECLQQLAHLKQVDFNKTLKLNQNFKIIKLFPADQRYQLNLLRDIDSKKLTSKQLEDLQNIRILSVNLEDINSKEIKYEDYSFFQQITNLEELSLQFNHKLDPNFEETFMNTLNVNKLTKLDLRFDDYRSTLSSVIPQILKNSLHLKELQLEIKHYGYYSQEISSYNDFENAFQYLPNLIKLVLLISDNNINNIFKVGKLFQHLKSLQDLQLNIQKKQKPEEEEDLNESLIKLTNLRNLKIISSKIGFINYYQILSHLIHLQKLEFEYHNYWLSHQFMGYCPDSSQIQYYQQFYTTQLPLKKIIFDKKVEDVVIQFKNIMILQLIITKETDYIIEQFNELMNQINQLKYLKRLSLTMTDEQNQSSWYDVLNGCVSQKEENNYTSQIDSLISTNEQQNIEIFNLSIRNFLFCHYHSQIIEKQMQFYNQLLYFKFELGFKNNIGEYGLESIFKSFQYLTSLIKLEIILENQTYFGVQAATALGTSFQKLQLLEYLQLFVGKQNRIMQQGLINLFEGLIYLKNLFSLDLEIKDEFNPDQLQDQVVLKAVEQMKFLNNLSIEVGSRFSIIQSTSAEIQTRYSQNLNTLSINHLYNYSQEGLQRINYSLLKTISVLKYLNNIQLSLINQEDQEDLILFLAQFLKDTKKNVIIYMVCQQKFKYFSDSQQSRYSNVTQLINTFEKLIETLPNSASILDLSIEILQKEQNEKEDKSQIVLCKSSGQIKLLLLLSFNIFEEVLEDTSSNIISQLSKIKNLSHLSLLISTQQQITEQFDIKLLQFISHLENLHFLKLHIQFNKILDLLYYKNVCNILQKLTNLFWAEIDFHQDDFSDMTRKIFLKRCKKLLHLDIIQQMNNHMEDVD